MPLQVASRRQSGCASRHASRPCLPAPVPTAPAEACLDAPDEEPDYVDFISAMDSLARSNPVEEIWVVSDNDDFFPLMTNYLGHKGIYDGNNMLKSLPPVKKKTILLLPLYDVEMEMYKPFLSAHNAQFLNRVSYVSFYKIDLTP